MQSIETEVFAELPQRLRNTGTPPERLAGNLYVVDLAWGRIFKINPKKEFEVVIEYDGEPNGLAIRKDAAHPDMGAVWIFNRRGEALYRVDSCKSDLVTNLAYQGNEIYITGSGSGCILRAKVPTPGRRLFSHL